MLGRTRAAGSVDAYSVALVPLDETLGKTRLSGRASGRLRAVGVAARTPPHALLSAWSRRVRAMILRQACSQECPGAPFAFKDLMIHEILQVTLRIAVRCVLHRCENQEIRC